MKKLLQEAIPSFSWAHSSLNYKKELLAALVGAIIVIPQGVTFSYLAGVPPEYGIYCSIFVTLIAALFGNSIMMSGPNTATAILLGLSVLPLAGSGSPLFIDYVLILSLMVGFIQILVWIFRGAKVFQYITAPSISGLTMGVGCLIMLSSLNGMFGLAPLKTNFFYEKIWLLMLESKNLINFYALSIGVITVVIGFLTRKRWPRNYHLIAIIVGTIFGLVLDDIYSAPVTNIAFLGSLDINIFNFSLPKLHSDYLAGAIQLLPAAFSIAFLSLAQSLVISRDLSSKASRSINLNKEIFAIGLANLIGSFFSAFAGSGSFNRTQVNEEMKAETPLAAITTGLIVLFIILTIGSLFRYLPLPVIAGVLFIVGYRMIKWDKIKEFWKQKFDFFVFSSVLFSVLFLGLSTAIVLAIVLSIYSALEGTK